jgi:hypothetical protein
MNWLAAVVALILIGVVGEELLLSFQFWWALGLFLAVGTAAHFISRHALARQEPPPVPQQTHPQGYLIWVLIALTGLLLPVFRLGRVPLVWLHLDAAAYVVFSLLPALQIAGREGAMERWRKRWPLALLVLLGLAVGGYLLDQIPISVHGDEGEMGCRAREVLRGQVHDLFAPGVWYSIPNFFFGVAALGLYVFGDNLFGLRMHVLVLGLGALFFTYLAAERLWGRRSACFVSLVLIGNHYFIHLMRCGVGYTQTTFLAAAVFYCFVRIYDDRHQPGNHAWIQLGGVLMGLGGLSYQANHILPMLWCLLFLFLWIMRQVNWRLFLRALLGAYASLLLMISPLLLIPGDGGETTFLDRSQQVMLWSNGSMRHLDTVYHTDGNRLRIWQEQFKRALFAPTVYTDTSVQYRGPSPLLDPVGAGLFMIGVVMACWSLFHVREAFAILWIVPILVVGAALTVDAPFYPRIAGVVPMLALVVGRTLDRLLTPQTPEQNKLAWGARIGVSSITLGVILLIHLHLYFQTYRPDRSIHYPVTAMARCIVEHGRETTTFFVVPPEFYFGIGTIRFLAPDYRGHDVADPALTIPRLRSEPITPILFIIGVHHTAAIKLVRQRYPDAKFTNHFNPDGVYLFTSALVPPTFEP